MMNNSVRNKISVVWNFFETLSSDVTNVNCTLCGCVLSRSGNRKSAGNTSLNNHIKTKHFTEFSAMQKEKQSSSSKQTEEQISLPSSSTVQMTLKESSEGKNKWDINDFRAKEIHYTIGEMIVADGQPLSIVEDIRLKRLMAKFKPHYSL